MLALDMNNGRIVVNEIFTPANRFNITSPIISLSAGTIETNFGGWEVELSLKKSSDEPPSPVASVTKLNPISPVFGAEKPDVKVAAG